MKLSIVTINYNDADGLKKTIESVVNQKFNNFQYIVVDGGSNDGSKDVLNQYYDQIDVCISERDSGIYNAMNKGARHAEGEYLLFLNSGDFLTSDSVLYEVFSYDFDEDIVSCNCIDFNEQKRFLKIPPKNISLFTFIGGSLPHPSTLIKRSVFESLKGYHEEYKIIGDWCFFIEALIINNCSYKTLPVEMTMFNCFGISSTNSAIEEQKCKEFLNKNFPRIASDYLPVFDEALSNVTFWISKKKGQNKKLWSLPFKCINRIINGRNLLKRRMGIHTIK